MLPLLLLFAASTGGVDVALTVDTPSGDATVVPALDALSEVIFSSRTLAERVRAGWEPAPSAFARARAALAALNGGDGDGVSNAPHPSPSLRADSLSAQSCAAAAGDGAAIFAHAFSPEADVGDDVERARLFSSWGLSDIMSIARLPLLIAAAFIYYRYTTARVDGSGGSVSREKFGSAAAPGDDGSSIAPSSTRAPRSFRTSFAHAYEPTNAEEPLSSESDSDEDAARARRVAHTRVRSRASLLSSTFNSST